MAAIIALTPPLIPLICFMDLANFMFLSRSCTHKEEEGQPHSSNTSRKSFARLFFPSCIIPNNISHKNSVQQRIFFNVNNVYAMSQCLKIGPKYSLIRFNFGLHQILQSPNHWNRFSQTQNSLENISLNHLKSWKFLEMVRYRLR